MTIDMGKLCNSKYHNQDDSRKDTSKTPWIHNQYNVHHKTQPQGATLRWWFQKKIGKQAKGNRLKDIFNQLNTPLTCRMLIRAFCMDKDTVFINKQDILSSDTNTIAGIVKPTVDHENVCDDCRISYFFWFLMILLSWHCQSYWQSMMYSAQWGFYKVEHCNFHNFIVNPLSLNKQIRVSYYYWIYTTDRGEFKCV